MTATPSPAPHRGAPPPAESVADLIERTDWSRSTLGPPDGWPRPLRTTVELILESKFPMFVAWGPGLALLYNDPYAEILGTKHPAALGQPLRAVWSEIAADLDPLLEAALGGNAFYREDLPFTINRRGVLELAWFTFSYSPVPDEDGRIAGVLCVATETTRKMLAERRQAFMTELADALSMAPNPRTAMTEAVGRLGRHLGAQRVGYGEVQPDDTTILLNSCYADGLAPLEGLFPLDGFGQQMIARQRRGETETCDDVAADPEDNAVWSAIDTRAFASVPLIRDGGFRASLYVNFREPHVWSADEVTLIEEVAERTWAAVERARAESELAASEQRFRAAVDAVQGILWTNSAAGEMQGEQPGWAALTGQSRDEYQGFGWAAAVHPDDAQPTLEAWNVAVAERRTFLFEHRVRRRDGSWGRHAIRAVPVFDADGALEEWVGVHTDVTAQREGEAVLADRVATAVAEREAALAQVHEMAKLETIGQLTGGIAHDFNNLLTPIVGGLDLLQRRYADDQRSQRLLTGAMGAAERARVLVSRLLSFARRQHLEPRPVDLAALIEGMGDLIDRSLGPQVEVRRALAPGLTARVDPNQLELALLNLCVNGRDAMPDGGVLTITAGVAGGRRPPGLAAGDYVRLAVADTGIGMTPETLSRAIEPFYTTKGTGKGTGLGLSMVHGLAAQSGGALVLDSTPGSGTTASLWLPAVAGEAMAAPPRDHRLAAPSRPLTVLLVDDEELVRQGTSEMLAGLGHGVIQAPSGAEALSRLRAGDCVDLLITDYAMSNMTGTGLVEAARILRPGLPAALITGFADLPADTAGDLPRLAKPFTLNGLAALIAEAETTVAAPAG